MKGNTPLALALLSNFTKKEKENDKIIRKLIEFNSSNLKIKNKEGNTLGHLVCKSQYYSPKVRF